MSLSPEEMEMIKKLSESGKFVITPKESEAPIAGAGFKTSTPFKQAEASRNELYEFENRVHDTQMVKGHLNVPKIPQFSGEDPPLKGDVSFREWRFEIQCLKNDPDITESILGQAIRRSLKGTARRMLVPLGEWATIGEILDKLDTLFGDISTNGMIMQEFFNAYQKADESVTVFGCRLETMLQVAIDNGYLARSAKSELLRHKFWTSLASEKLKSQTRHKYDTLRDYDELLREIRRVEKEININTDASGVTGTGSGKKVHQHSQQSSNEGSRSLANIEERFEKKLEGLEKRMEEKIDRVLEKLNQGYHRNSRYGQDKTRGQTGSYDHRGRGRRGQGQSRGPPKHIPSTDREDRLEQSMTDSCDTDSEGSDIHVQRYIIPQRRKERLSPFRASTVSEVHETGTPFFQAHSPITNETSQVVASRETSETNHFETMTEGVNSRTQPSGHSEINDTPPRRSGRERKPPDRFGQWVFPQTVSSSFKNEIFV